MLAQELALLERAQRRDVAAFEELLRPYQAQLFRLVLAVAGNREDAEDSLQEALIRAYKARSHSRGHTLDRGDALRPGATNITLPRRQPVACVFWCPRGALCRFASPRPRLAMARIRVAGRPLSRGRTHRGLGRGVLRGDE